MPFDKKSPLDYEIPNVIAGKTSVGELVDYHHQTTDVHQFFVNLHQAMVDGQRLRLAELAKRMPNDMEFGAAVRAIVTA